MDQARMFIAIVLSFLVFFVWEMFFVDRDAMKQPVEAPAPQGEAMAPDVATGEQTTSVAPADTGPAVSAAPGGIEKKAGRNVVVQTRLYEAVLDEDGAVFKSFVLKKYRKTVAPDSENLELIDPKVVGDGSVELGFVGQAVKGLDDAVYRCNAGGDTVLATEEEKTLTFTWRSPDGLVIEKRYRFQPESYVIPMTVSIQNRSDRVATGSPYLALRKFSPDKDMRYGFQGPSGLIDNRLEQVKVDDIEDKDTFSGKFEWVALQDRYFMSCLIPQSPAKGNMKIAIDDNRLLESRFISEPITLGPGRRIEQSYEVFFGPLSVRLLKSLGHQLDRSVDFGWFDFIAKPCLWIMNFLYQFIPNYGIAIIILTLMTKVLLWPLGNKSYKSMSEMKKIQSLSWPRFAKNTRATRSA